MQQQGTINREDMLELTRRMTRNGITTYGTAAMAWGGFGFTGSRRAGRN